MIYYQREIKIRQKNWVVSVKSGHPSRTGKYNSNERYKWSQNGTFENFRCWCGEYIWYSESEVYQIDLWEAINQMRVKMFLYMVQPSCLWLLEQIIFFLSSSLVSTWCVCCKLNELSSQLLNRKVIVIYKYLVLGATGFSTCF